MKCGDPIWYLGTRSGLRGYPVRRRGFFLADRGNGSAEIFIEHAGMDRHVTRVTVPNECIQPRDQGTEPTEGTK